MKLTSRTASAPRRTDGIALLVVLISIITLSILAAGFAYSVKVETRLAENANADAQMLWLGRSGVELARYVLMEQTTIASEPYDSLNQIWAGGPGSVADSNSVLASIQMTDYPLGKGKFSVKIVDLERKVNINTASQQMLQKALNLMGVDADRVSVVSDSILDWIDPNDAPRVAGAEDDYYQSLSPPYHCKNAPMDDLSELLLVRGVTPAMYWGPAAANRPPAAFQHKLGFAHAPGEEPDYPFGLVDVFTPLSSGLININTADATVLQILPGVDEATADDIIKARAGPDGVDGTEDDTPFRNPNQLATAGVNPAVVGQIARFCTVRSSTFAVTVTATIGSYTRQYHAILFRYRRDVHILSFYWK